MERTKNEKSFEEKMFEVCMREKKINKNISQDEKIDKLEKLITEKLVNYVSDNCFNEKQINGLIKMITSICIDSGIKELQMVASHIEFEGIEKFEDTGCQTFRLPAECNIKRKKMKNPDTSAYVIDFQKDIKNYLNSLKVPISINKIDLLLYGDDITVSQPLGPSRRQNSFTHLAYRVMNIDIIKSSSLYHYRTLAIAYTKYAKQDRYESLIKQCIELINSTTIDIDGKKIPVGVKFVVGDNVFLNCALKAPLIFTNRGRNNCRTCTVSGPDWVKYKTPDEVKKYVRIKHSVPHIPVDNHLLSDPFHDVLSGVLNYVLSGCVNVFLSLTKKVVSEDNLIKLILEQADIFNRQNEIRTLMYTGIFKALKCTGKRRLNLSGSQILLISRCFYTILTTNTWPNVDGSTIIKLDEIKLLLEISLNLAYGTIDYTTEVPKLAEIFHKNVEKLFELLFKLFGQNFSITAKMHNLLHYSYCIKKLNLRPSEYSTIRFESSNTRIKKILFNTKSRINPCKTVIKRINFINDLNFKLKNYVLGKSTETIHDWNYTNVEIPTKSLQVDDPVEQNVLETSSFLLEYIEDNETLSNEFEPDDDPIDFTYYP
uniref:DUF4806 domain-containing protein n=1 Tax=Strongyloides venezuelensis TaxID=75913 RepID=A0A0K0FTI5_STRVS